MNQPRFSIRFIAMCLLLASGCAIGEVDTPLERLVNFPPNTGCTSKINDENSWNLYLIDEQTQEPLANVEIVRVDPIPNPDSLWSWIKYGDEDYLYKKVTQTDAQGHARIFKSKEIKLEARLDTAVLRLDFEQHQAKLIPLHLSNVEARALRMHEVKPGSFTVLVPGTSPSK